MLFSQLRNETDLDAWPRFSSWIALASCYAKTYGQTRHEGYKLSYLHPGAVGLKILQSLFPRGMSREKPSEKPSISSG